MTLMLPYSLPRELTTDENLVSMAWMEMYSVPSFIMSLPLSPGAKLLYMLLCEESLEFKNTSKFLPGTYAKTLNESLDNITKWTEELIEKKLLTTMVTKEEVETSLTKKTYWYSLHKDTEVLPLLKKAIQIETREEPHTNRERRKRGI